jgi:hypothetical protein
METLVSIFAVFCHSGVTSGQNAGQDAGQDVVKCCELGAGSRERCTLNVQIHEPFPAIGDFVSAVSASAKQTARWRPAARGAIRRRLLGSRR